MLAVTPAHLLAVTPSHELRPEEYMAYNIRRKRKEAPSIPPPGPSKFTEKLLRDMAKDVKSGAIPLTKKKPWLNLGDDRAIGLRAIIRKSGAVTFHAMYQIEDSRPMITVGHFPDTTIEEARHLTKIVRGLAAKGIDVQSGLHQRLLQELERDGLNWRPDRNTPTVTPVKVMRELEKRGIKIPPAVVRDVTEALKDK